MKQFKDYFEKEVKLTNLEIVPTWDECLEYLEPYAYDFKDEGYEDDIKETIQEFVEGFTKERIKKKMFEEYRRTVGCSKNDFKNCYFFIGTKEELFEDMELREDVPKDKEKYFDETYDEVKYGFVERVL